MRKLASLLAAAITFLALPAAAQICGPVPFTIVNGTITDADEVMANYNAITDCVNLNSAKNGANSDITSITGLTTPLAISQGGTPVYVAGVSSTVVNTYVGNSVNPPDYSLSNSKYLWFLAPATNTAASTMNVTALGAKTIKRSTTGGKIDIAAGAITSGQVYGMTYDGTDYVMVNPSAKAPQVTYLTTPTGLGTYTTPVGAVWIKATVVGGGGGGAGGPGGVGGAGGNANSTSFGGSAVANGGLGGVNTGSVPAAVSASGGSVNIFGSRGHQGAPSVAGAVAGVGGSGGSSCLGDGGAGVYNGAGLSADATVPGAGGGGGASDSTTSNIGGSGGGSGACSIIFIGPPLAATYNYAIGAGGAPGAGGAGGYAGAAGRNGALIIEAYFQ